MRKFIFLCLLMGCGGEVIHHPTVLHGSTAFSLEERARIESANVWLAEKTAGEPFYIEWDDGVGGYQILRRGLSGVCGAAGSGGISIDADHLGLDEVEIVAAHELGHMRRMTHHEGPGLMNEFVQARLEWTPEDTHQCHVDGVCR